MLSKLEVSSMEAKKEADAVAKIKEVCQADAKRIAGEKVVYYSILYYDSNCKCWLSVRVMLKRI